MTLFGKSTDSVLVDDLGAQVEAHDGGAVRRVVEVALAQVQEARFFLSAEIHKNFRNFHSIHRSDKI